MNANSPVSRNAFTLIELLIVIAIMMILAGLVSGLAWTALRNAKVAQAQQDVREVHNAVYAYYHEYQKVPLSDALAQGRSCPAHGGDQEYWVPLPNGVPWDQCWIRADETNELRYFYGVLTGQNINGDNPKGIVFLKRDLGTDGFLRDPWGTPYSIALDGDYDGNVEIEGQNWLCCGFTGNTRVIVMSPGPDKNFNTAAFGGVNATAEIRSDDIFSHVLGRR